MSDFGDLSEFVAVVNHAEIDFVGDEEELVFFGDFDDAFDGLFAINSACWIVWIDDEDASDFGMSLDLRFEMFEIRLPVVVGVEFVADGVSSGAEGFHGSVRWITRHWLDDAAASWKHVVKSGDSGAETANEKDVFVVEVGAGTVAASVFTNPFAGFGHATRVGVTENAVAFTIDFFFDNGFEKWGNGPTFGDRVADIFGSKFEV